MTFLVSALSGCGSVESKAAENETMTIRLADQSPSFALVYSYAQDKGYFNEVFKNLTPREQQTIYYIYFMSKDDDENSVRKSRTELAKILNATPKKVKLIQEKALRKLRHPSRLRKLNGYYEKPHKH